MSPDEKPDQTRTSPHADPDRIQAIVNARHREQLVGLLERAPVWARDFADLRYEWRRLFSELFGTFLLVLVGSGAPVLDAATHGQIGRVAEVTSPGLMVLAIILFMGAVSGAHLNPIVSIAFALRGDFGWLRVPGYLGAQLAGALLASMVLRMTFGDLAHLGATLPGAGFSATQAFVVETILSLGLVSTILGTASSAQNIGPLSAFGVAAYIALAGLWSSPVSGASMNPARSLAPALIGSDLHDLWIYLTAPPLGAVAAVAASYILRGPGGDPGGTQAARGRLPDPGNSPGPDRHRR
ncbi:MIP/aquaporin family protein [Pseudonocardia sp. Cha107L01]|jgi:aquaporin Z|uniref:MIP/aquaporin family protein n=1 Tax=Pseudonocardia sp. Cha107L01 TaxID=3457576 RepID=UPI00403EE26C